MHNFLHSFPSDKQCFTQHASYRFCCSTCSHLTAQNKWDPEPATSHFLFTSTNKDAPIQQSHNWYSPKSNSKGLCLVATERKGLLPAFWRGAADGGGWHYGGVREVKRCGRREAAGPVCVIRPAVVIHRVRMLPALCADRDKRLLLSRGLIGLFTSYNWEGERQCVCVCVRQRESRTENEKLINSKLWP